ncbi:MAG: hypothetical protein U5R31_16015 [Acidimicrobiia bacterium]|nr:hypothetical protein [Acidimicrobiia bacterium]
MRDDTGVIVTLPADVNQVDETGHVWAFVDQAADPARVVEGALIVAGDPEEPFLAGRRPRRGNRGTNDRPPRRRRRPRPGHRRARHAHLLPR